MKGFISKDKSLAPTLTENQITDLESRNSSIVKNIKLQEKSFNDYDPLILNLKRDLKRDDSTGRIRNTVH